MKQPTTQRNDSLTEAEVQAIADVQAEDLQLTDEELDGIKGGHGVTVLAWARVDGIAPATNYNETMEEDAASENIVEDLSPTTVEATSVKAGGGWGASMYQYAYNDPNVVRPPMASSLVRP